MPQKSYFGRKRTTATTSTSPTTQRCDSPASQSSVPPSNVVLPYRTLPQASTNNQSAAPTLQHAPWYNVGSEQVPPGWKAQFDEKYRTWFYVNIYTEVSQWQKPTAAACESVPAGWKAEWDSRYKQWYYVNVYTERSQWQKPLLEATRKSSLQSSDPRLQFTTEKQRRNPWYILQPQAFRPEDANYLCDTCRHIDLNYVFHEAEPARTAPLEAYIRLGTFRKIAENSSCGLCRIVTATIRERIRLSTKQNGLKLEADVETLLTTEWFLSPFVYHHESKPVKSYNLLLQHSLGYADQQHRQLPDEDSPFAIRLIINEERGGRRIPSDTLDFSWIKETLSLCDLNTKMPVRNFDYPILVVDTEQMCVAELDVKTDEKYAALSYPWGNVEQYGLTRGRKADFEQPGGLNKIYDRLARTIQDAIVLVSKVGIKYLWVDSLCIVQDDDTEKVHHIGQMEQIYRYAYFTIFAVSGQGADFGLPGMRKGSRALTQVVENVSGLHIANCLPYFNENIMEQQNTGAWSTRAWTFQERYFTQRSLFVGNEGMHMNCAHINTPEDEHCWHPLQRQQNMLVEANFFFFAGLDNRCEPYLTSDRCTRFDYLTMCIYNYTQRKLKYDSDAIRAFSGVLRKEARTFGCEILCGIPEAELDAGLLWSPVGPSARRTEFPSWSWAGWTGTAAYYWTHERDTFMSIEHSPLEWLDATVAGQHQGVKARLVFDKDGLCKGVTYNDRETLIESDETAAAWFTSDDLCLPDSELRDRLLRLCRRNTDDHLGVRGRCRANMAKWRTEETFRQYWPNETITKRTYMLPLGPEDYGRLTFRTLTQTFSVVGQPFQRERRYNIKEPIWRLEVCDRNHKAAGYIDIPDPCETSIWRAYLGSRKFAVLSRSTIDGQFDPPPDSLEVQRKVTDQSSDSPKLSLAEMRRMLEEDSTQMHMNEAGWFDSRVYDATRPWCMFNVLLLSQEDGVSRRTAIGRIHVDAFLGGDLEKEVVELE